MATPLDIAAQLGLVDPRLLLCQAVVDDGMQDGAVAAAYLGGMIPAVLAVVFLSTPKLRRQWAFRILVFALIVNLVRCALGMRVSWRRTKLDAPLIADSLLMSGCRQSY